MRHIALILPAVLAAVPAFAQTPGKPPRFETLGDAHQRQQADDYRSRENSRSLLQNERSTPLGDLRVHMTPGAGYTTQPQNHAPSNHR